MTHTTNTYTSLSTQIHAVAAQMRYAAAMRETRARADRLRAAQAGQIKRAARVDRCRASVGGVSFC